MLCYHHYIVRPTSRLADICEEDEDLLYTIGKPVIIRNPEGGCRCTWETSDYAARIKILYLNLLKKKYELPFLEALSLSEESFDTWWTLEPVDEMFTFEELASNWVSEDANQLIPTTSLLANRSLLHHELPRSQPWGKWESMCRVYWEGGMIGWFKRPEFAFPYARGTWGNVITPKGKEFKRDCIAGHTYEVVVEGPSVYRARLRIDGEAASLEFLSEPV